MPYAVTPAPPAGPLHALYWNVRGPLHGWRPRGTRDWLLIYTQTGSLLVRYEGGREFRTGPGDLILYRPGTAQDYGQHEAGKSLRHVWTHWVPRPEVMEWLDWPLLAPGLHHLHAPPPQRAPILSELVRMSDALRSDEPRREQVALNALERALLRCDRLNPARIKVRHPRIEATARELASDLLRTPSLTQLARQAGFSRSRFSALFTAQIGESPRRFQELQRLARARDLLLYTGQTLGQIAEHVGFESHFYLSLRFKRHFGQSPREFRRSAARK